MLKFSRKVVLVWTDRCFDSMTLLQPQINYIARCVYTVITVCGPRRGKTHHKAQDTNYQALQFSLHKA